MKKLFVLILLIPTLACSAVGTLTPQPETTITPTVTITPTRVSAKTNTPESTATEAIELPTLENTPTQLSQAEHIIVIYSPEETPENDSFVEVVAPYVYMREGASVGYPKIANPFENSNDPNDDFLRAMQGETYVVYVIYWDKTVNVVWVRVTPDGNDVQPRWIAVLHGTCRPDRICSVFK